MPTEITEGEKLVAVSFNPGQNEDVQEIKALTAQLIDKINELHAKREAPTYHQNMIHGEATRKIMSASMWAVKDATWDL